MNSAAWRARANCTRSPSGTKVSAVRRREMKHKTCWLIVYGIEHESHVHLSRPGEIDDHARAALHHKPETERFDQTATHLPGLSRELEGDLRHVHHDPIGIGEREG